MDLFPSTSCERFQPSLRDENYLCRVPGVETPGYHQPSLRDAVLFTQPSATTTSGSVPYASVAGCLQEMFHDRENISSG